MNKKEQKFFSLAKKISLLSNTDRIHMGAVLVIKHTVVGVGCNTTKTHPLQRKLNRLRFNGCCHTHDGQIHAEFSAIIGAKDIDLSKAELYIYRENKDGKLACCRPCKACMSLIKHRGIKVINYTTADGFVREVLL